MSFYATYPVGSGSIPRYANLAAFPSAASAGNGALAIALDTDILYISNGATWSAIGTGTVTSVGLSLPADFTVSGSPVIGAGTLTAVYATQSANLLFAGPTTGAAAAPTFRSIVLADLPGPASGAVSGYLSSADWTTFNSKQAAVSIGALDSQAANATGLALSGAALSTQSADATHPGLVNNTGQTFTGVKTFSSTIVGNISGNAGGTSTNVTGIVLPDHGGTGIANNAASTLTISGSFATSLTISGATALTLPTSGIVCTDTANKVLDTNSAFDLNLSMASTPTFTANRTLSFILPDADRSLHLGQNFTTAGTGSLSFTTTGTTSLTVPTAGTLTSDGGTTTLTNKTLIDGSTTVANTSDTTKHLKFDLSGETTGKTLTLASVVTADSTLTFPNAATGSLALNPLTTTGDLIYASNTATPATLSRLAFGAAGTVLKTDSGSVPSWAQVVNADIDPAAAIAGSKLQAVGQSNAGVVASAGQLLATNTNDAASAGNVGQYLQATQTGTAAAASTTWKELATITLTAGDWDVSCWVMEDPNGATGASSQIIALATATASATGAIFGVTELYNALATTNIPQTWGIPSIRVSVASSTPYFLNGNATWTGGGTPQWYGGLTARRAR